MANKHLLPSVPNKTWIYFPGFPATTYIYFVGGSLDFFYSFFHELINTILIDPNELSFQTVKTKECFLAEISIKISTKSVFHETLEFLKKKKIEWESESINICANYKETKQRSIHFHENSLSLLKLFDEKFFYSRSLRFLYSLTKGFFHFRNQLIANDDCKNKLYLKLMKSELLNESDEEIVLGIAIGLCRLNTTKGLNEHKLLKIIQSIIPGVAVVPRSFMQHENPQGADILYYLEVKKMRGGEFNIHELGKLRTRLPFILKNRVGSAQSAVHFPDNEENTYHDLTRLGSALKSIDDLPQVLITFQQIRNNVIRFKTMIVFINSKELSVKCIQNSLPKIVKFIPKHTLTLGPFGKNHLKKGLIFDLETESDFFVRPNDEVDLISARLYIAKSLEESIGSYRDCNGGLLQKQNEQLQLIKDQVGDKGYEHHSILETLFYNLTPPFIQAVIPSETAYALLLLFLDVRNKEIKGGCIWETRDLQDARLLVVKAQESVFLDALVRQANEYKNSASLLGKALIEIEGMFYFCFFQLHTEENFIEKLVRSLEIGITSTHSKLQLAKKVLKLNFHDGVPPSLNPQITGDVRSFVLYKSLFECLTRINSEGNVELAAAENVEITNEGTEYHIHIRPMQWSNGEKLTAHHFANAWRNALHPHSGCPRADIFYPILHAEKAKKGEIAPEKVGILVKNPSLLIVKLEKPSPYFLDLLAHPLCSPLYGDSSEPSIFNGPFICTTVKGGGAIKLVRNPFYWDLNNVFLDEIQIHSIKNPWQTLELFEKKELDIVGDPFSPLPFEILPELQLKGVLQKKSVCRPFYLHCNTSYFPLRNAKIRKALSLSINRVEIAKKLSWEPSLLTSPLPGQFSILSSNEDSYDEKAAQQLFEDGLNELSLTKNHFPPLIFSHDNANCFKKIADMITEQWQKVLNLNVSKECLDWDKLYANFDIGKFHLGGTFQTAFYNDPLFYLKMFKDSSRLINKSAWKNKTYNDLVVAIENAKDNLQLRKQAEELLIEEMPVIPLLNQTYNFLLGKHINGFFISSRGYIDLKTISLKDKTC